jgi:hypothetical protein
VSVLDDLWSTPLIKLMEQLSEIIWTSLLPMSTNHSTASISPLPYLTAVPGGASRRLCVAGIRFTALSGMVVVTWVPVSTMA